MPNVTPFRGLLYDPSRIADISRVVAPPYDMISTSLQRELYDRDPHNVVRLILGLETPSDGEVDNRYTRAARELDEWRREGVLVRDASPAIYLYEQEYGLPRGGRLTRRGFIARYRLEEIGEGSIHPHEKTMAGPKEDRLRLMTACRANFSQVFSVYDDPAGEVEATLAAAPAERRFELTDAAGVRHVLSSVTDPATHARVEELMATRSLFIADGHHRYETALNFRRMMKERLGVAVPEGYDHVMMYFANGASPGLTIFPFHRLLSLPAGSPAGSLVERLGTVCRIEPVEDAGGRQATLEVLLARMAEAPDGEHRFGVYAPPRFHLASCEAVPGSGPVEELDVSILHGRLLPAALGPAPGETAVAYLTDEREILASVDAGRAGLVFFLNPTRVNQVRKIAGLGLRMPPKSTNFHPKLLSGLVLHPLED